MNYYNEWDSFAAEWLKELIKDGLIPNGEVDTRSIADVEPTDLKGFTQCHFFAGIGGWSRALQIAGWSSDRPVWTGSPPCQSFSTAGSRKGKDDERHLWPVFFNLIRECQPPTVFGEQVAAAIRFGWLDDLQIDFEKEGYAAGAFVLPAGSIGAPHKRERLFFVADSQSKGGHRGLRPIHQENEKQQTCKEQGQDRTCKRVDGGSTNSVADSNDLRHEWSEGARWETQRGAEYSGAVSMADSESARLSQYEQFAESSSGASKKGASNSSRDNNAQQNDLGGAVSMADSEPEGFQWRLSRRSDQERQNLSGHTGRCGATDSLVNSDSNRPESRDETAKTARHRDSIDSASFWAEAVGNAEHDGSYGAEVGRSAFETSNCGKKGQDVSCESEGAGRSEIARDIRFWKDSTTIYCRDGKYRSIPTEPALFPLADGISNRVGILRGAGNAIVPQAAAEIIKAYLYD